MKRILLLLVALLLLVTMLSCEKDDVEKDDQDGYLTEDGEIVSPDGDNSELVLPDLEEPITLPEDIFE